MLVFSPLCNIQVSLHFPRLVFGLWWLLTAQVCWMCCLNRQKKRQPESKSNSASNSRSCGFATLIKHSPSSPVLKPLYSIYSTYRCLYVLQYTEYVFRLGVDAKIHTAQATDVTNNVILNTKKTPPKSIGQQNPRSAL